MAFPIHTHLLFDCQCTVSLSYCTLHWCMVGYYGISYSYLLVVWLSVHCISFSLYPQLVYGLWLWHFLFILTCCFTVNALYFFLTVPSIGIWSVIVAFPDHTHLLFDCQCTVSLSHCTLNWCMVGDYGISYSYLLVVWLSVHCISFSLYPQLVYGLWLWHFLFILTCCLIVSALYFFLTVPSIGIWSVIVAFPDHTHLLFDCQCTVSLSHCTLNWYMICDCGICQSTVPLSPCTLNWYTVCDCGISCLYSLVVRLSVHCVSFSLYPQMVYGLWLWHFLFILTCCLNSLLHRDAIGHFCKQSRPRSGSSCKSCLIKVYSVCLWKYD